MNDHVSLKCRCGALRGRLTGLAQSSAKRIVCLCDDCQSFAHYLGRAQDVLDANGGTDVYPSYHSQIQITQGIEHLQCLRLSPKGMLRWYAACCKTPIANSPYSHKVPYVGLIHSFMDHAADGTTRDAALGPIHARVQGKFGIGPLPSGTHQTAPLPVILDVVVFLFRGWIKRRHQPSPFFEGSSGLPRVKPYVLTLDERKTVRKLCGPA